jgi:hypothetical protein
VKDRNRQAIGRARALVEEMRGGATVDIESFFYAEAIGDLAAENDRLRAKLSYLRKFLLGVARRKELGFGSQDLIDEAAEIQKIFTPGEPS